MTIKDAISYITKHVRDELANKDADTVAIMRNVAELNESGILQNLNKELTQNQIRRLKRIVRRLKKNEPLEHILRSCVFHGRHLYVSPDTLIPRVETETLVDMTIAYAQEKQFSDTSDQISIVDVGTGSGCIIISTALTLREPAKYYATDISPKALSIARKNIAAYKLGRQIKTFEGNLLEPIDEKVSFDIVMANLPYIASRDISTLLPSVRDYEPHLALDGGENGVDVIRELLVQSQPRLNKNGVILLEIQPKIIPTVRAFTRRFYPNAAIETVEDTYGAKRIMTIRT